MNRKIKYGLIHCHTQNSKKDSAITVNQLVTRAKELNAPAITLTNHGTMIDIFEFMKECKNANIKGVPGVEAYYSENENIYNLKSNITNNKRFHLILLPKDDIGLHALYKCVSESYKRLENKEFPCMNNEILKKYIGKGTKGYDHVIASSACIGGILSQILLYNFNIEKKINKYTELLKKINIENIEADTLNLKNIEDSIIKLKEDKKIKEKLANKKYKRIESVISKINNQKEKEEKLRLLNNEKKESEDAINELKKIKKEIEKKKKQLPEIKEKLKKHKKNQENYNKLQNKINEIKNEKLTEKVLYDEAKLVANYMNTLFGNGNFYIELQYHYIDEEKYVMPLLVRIANELNIPTIVTNDIHILKNTENDILARQIQRSLNYKDKWIEANIGDKELYMKTDKELKEILMKILPEDIIDISFQNIEKIFNKCNVEMKITSHYPKFKSKDNKTSDEILKEMTYKGIEWRFPNKKGWTKIYEERLEYELNVISTMGYSDYHCIEQDILAYGRLLGKLPDEEIQTAPLDIQELENYLIKKGYKTGYGIGPGRGSAVGSLVCYLIGITGIDPIKYNLIFERFLNIERVSMPDIDTDFKTNIRDRVIDYVKYKYGEESVCRINTKGTQAVKASIHNCARLLGSKENDQKKYYQLGCLIAKEVPDTVNIKFKDILKDTIKTQIDKNGLEVQKNIMGLETKFINNQKAKEIINNACLVEGKVLQYGIHAAGVIITDGNPVSDYIPIMYDSDKKVWKTQCDMIESEENGLLKMDFLNLNNLNMISDTLNLIKNRYGKIIDVEHLPIDKYVLNNIYCCAMTNFIFQFESIGMKNMLLEFKPTNFEDIILLVAAYRPGPKQYLPKIINIKHKKEPISYLVPELESILNKTYGSIIYQEQVMEIFQKLAGYSLGQADLVRRAMSKKKEKIIIKERQSFIYGDKERNIKGCIANNIDEKKANELYDEIIDFAKYAFNKSHAAAYALVSYITAYLKYYYPLEFLCSVIKNIDDTKEIMPKFIHDCKKYNIEVLLPDINTSQKKTIIHNDSILLGLSTILGLGESIIDPIIEERKLNGIYCSLKKLIYRTKITKSICEKLIYSGSLDVYDKNRNYLYELSNYYTNLLSQIKDKENSIIKLQKKNIIENNKNISIQIETIKSEITNIVNTDKEPIIEVEDNEEDFLLKEHEIYGEYISKHPLNSYKDSKEYKCTNISEILNKSYIYIMGIINNLSIYKQKKDGKDIAFFELEDKTEKVKVCCFSNVYEEYKEYIKEGKIVKIYGKVMNKDDAYCIYMNKIEFLEKKLPTLLICINNIDEWIKLEKRLCKLKIEQGYSLIIYNRELNEIRQCNYKISKDFINNIPYQYEILDKI